MIDSKEIALAAQSLFALDSATGVVVRAKTAGGVIAGSVVGYARKDGYLGVGVCGVQMLLHRVVWLLHYGEWPCLHVDHINGNKTDNRPENLRSVSRTTNNQNRRGPNKNNSLGILGVRENGYGKFLARIRVNTKLVRLGLFKTPEEASQAYMDARRALHEGNTL